MYAIRWRPSARRWEIAARARDPEGYRGPEFGYASMPDQYTLEHFRREELAPRDRPPVMAEIDLISSHHPWTPLPQPVPWDRVGDGSVFDGMPEQGLSADEAFEDPDLVRRLYGESIEYEIETESGNITATIPDPHEDQTFEPGRLVEVGFEAGRAWLLPLDAAAAE